ncbi:AAA ATPase [Haplosporangium sp. Z 27]|nr:AAA ATPase [Haplosporangium sp. Z 27]
MTPTRRSPRRLNKTTNVTEAVFVKYSDQQQNQMLLSTPLKKKPVDPLASLSPYSSSNLIDCNNTTGLTPAMKRILKPSKESAGDIVNGYSTPARIPRLKRSSTITSVSCLEPVSRPVITRTLSNISDLSSTSTGSSCVSTAALSSTDATLELYQDAKSLFRRTAEPYRLVGRSTEREVIKLFYQNHVLSPKAGSLYISGQPGTGKTALLKEIMRDLEPEMKKASHDIKVVSINCMTIKDPRLIYSRMLEALGVNTRSGDKNTEVKIVESLVFGDKKKIMYVIILDEIDHLLIKDQDVLYRLFEWSCTENSKLSLIGIANALDMTDRFLPRLKAKNCEPQLLNFNPYQVSEIKEIIMDRLFSLDSGTPKNKNGDSVKSGRSRSTPLMQQPAIELCARKVAAATGDLRRVLDICRHAIEMVETEAKKKEKRRAQQDEVLSTKRTKIMPLQEISLADLENRIAGGVKVPSIRSRTTTSSSPPSPLLPPTPTTSLSFSDELSPFYEGTTIQQAPKVTVEHMKKALVSAFGSPIIQKMKALNLHQKIVMAVLVMKIQTNKINDCDVGKVYEQYAAVCRGSNKIGAVNRSEYQDLINMLEAGGIVTLGKAKEERLRKLNLVSSESEILEGIKGHDIIDTILAKAGI